MMVAAVAVVWHGAVALVAHPPNGGQHEPIVAAAASAAGHVHQHHVHQHNDGAAGNHATHEHGKGKPGGDCCSAVSAVTLPLQNAAKTLIDPVAMVQPIAAILGEGLSPATPAKPPRPTYQS